MTTNALPRNFSIPEAAEWLGCTPRTVYHEINAGRLQTFKIRRRRMVSARALEQYVADRESEVAA